MCALSMAVAHSGRSINAAVMVPESRLTVGLVPGGALGAEGYRGCHGIQGKYETWQVPQPLRDTQPCPSHGDEGVPQALEGPWGDHSGTDVWRVPGREKELARTDMALLPTLLGILR